MLDLDGRGAHPIFLGGGLHERCAIGVDANAYHGWKSNDVVLRRPHALADHPLAVTLTARWSLPPAEFLRATIAGFDEVAAGKGVPRGWVFSRFVDPAQLEWIDSQLVRQLVNRRLERKAADCWSRAAHGRVRHHVQRDDPLVDKDVFGAVGVASRGGDRIGLRAVLDARVERGVDHRAQPPVRVGAQRDALFGWSSAADQAEHGLA